MNLNELVTVIGGIIAAINGASLIYFAWKRLKPEVKKVELEGESEIVSAANLNLEGAEVSMKFLTSTIEQLKKDIEAEKKARQEDAQYFRRRIKELDREARDYRLWAARLAKQVIEAGKQPVPFISSMSDSDSLISAITKEQDELEKTKTKREEDIKDAGRDSESS